MEKRFKSIAVVMAMAMAMSFTAPSAALAYYHHYRPHYSHHYYHHGHSHHWSSGRAWAWGLGLAGLAWLAHKNTNNATYAQPVMVYDARTQFINSLDKEELKLFTQLNALAPSSAGRMYVYKYGDRDVTRRRLQKIMSVLSNEYRFEGADNGCVFFTKF